MDKHTRFDPRRTALLAGIRAGVHAGIFAGMLGGVLPALFAASPAIGSPEDLRIALRRFAETPQGLTLRFGIVMAPIGPGRLPRPAAPVSPGAPADTLGAADTHAASDTLGASELPSDSERWSLPPEHVVPNGLAFLGDRLVGPDVVRAFGDRPLVPASVTKLVTTLAALETFGPRHVFKTEVLATGALQDGVLHGDLIVRGGGDPFLVTERIWLLALELRKLGLREVEGRLLVDNTRFVPEAADSARVVREHNDRPYAAGLSALAVNFNSAAFRVRPGETIGAPGIVELDPVGCSYFTIRNRLRTVGPEGPNAFWLQLRPAYPEEIDSIGLGPDSCTVEEIAFLDGSVALGADPAFEYCSVDLSDRYSASILRAFLADIGLVIRGRTVIAATPHGARTLVSFPSAPMSALVESTNRYSNNFMADLLAMSLGGQPMHGNARANFTNLGATLEPVPPVSLSGGARWLTHWLHREIHAGAAVRLEDGSGLSLQNRLSADALFEVLRRAWLDFEAQPAFVGSLPAPGEEGTLKKRFRADPPLLRAKTGTLGDGNVSCLAGYFDDPARGIIAFSMLMNGSPAWSVSGMQALQEEWVRLYLR